MGQAKKAAEFIDYLRSHGITFGASSIPAVNDPTAQLGKLAELHDAGVLTDEKFAAKKADILARM